MKNEYKFLIAGGVILAGIWLYRKFGAVLSYDVKFQNFRVGFNGFTPTIAVDTVWKNNSSQRMDITGLYGNVLVNGVNVGQLQNKDSLLLDAGQTGTMTMQVNISPLALGQSASDIVKNLTSTGANIVFDGYVTLNGVTVPIKKTLSLLQYG